MYPLIPACMYMYICEHACFRTSIYTIWV